MQYQYTEGEARKRYEAGLSWTEAADDIALGEYSARGDAKRIAVNVNSLYRKFSGDPTRRPVPICSGT